MAQDARKDAPQDPRKKKSGTDGPGKDAGADRRERVAARQAEQRRRDRGRGLLVWGGLAVLVLALAGAATWGILQAGADQDEAEQTLDEEVQTYDDLGRDHVAGEVDYEQTPPVGGDHNAVWQTCDVYTEPLQDEFAVHSLEHGAVWVTYDPELPDDEVSQVEDLLGSSGYVLISPDPDQDAPVVLSAWGAQLEVESPDDAAVEPFLQEYVQGAQTPEPGAACTNGVTQTGDDAAAVLAQLAAQGAPPQGDGTAPAPAPAP